MSYQNTQSQQLTEEQKSTVKDVLSQYDPSNLSESDMQEIKSAMDEAGIKPGRGMMSAMKEAGFEPPEGGRGPQGAGRPEGPPPGGKNGGAGRPSGPPPGGAQGMSRGGSVNQAGSGIDASSFNTIMEIFEQAESESIDTDTQQSIYDQLQSSGLYQSGLLLDVAG
jgi:hypothetical protein